MNPSTQLPTVLKSLRLAFLPLLLVGTTTFLGFMFHVRGEKVVDGLLRERLLSTAAIASKQFDASDIARIDGPNDESSDAYKEVVGQLKDIRSMAPGVRFAYIMRKTDDPMMLTFVADADALSSVEQLDVDKSGAVDPDEEPGLPGDEYPIEEIPALHDKAFLMPVVDDEFTVDQWGTLLSAYAPITDDNGNVVAVLGLDMIADEFYAQTQATFSILAVSLVTLAGALIAIYAVLVVRARKTETLKQLDAERAALLDLATHQLGMPLATFRWWLEILRERDNGQFCKRGDVCDQLQEGIDRMTSIITALRDVGNVESNKNNNRVEKTSVQAALKFLSKDLKKTFAIRQEKLDLQVSPNLPLVNIDKKLFTGLMRELIENACFYSKTGATVTVNAIPVRKGVQIEIRDGGIGIPQNDLVHIFEKFRRGSNATALRPVGNGLGLFIVKRILDKAKGKIKIRSILGKGTSIHVFVPAA